MDPKDKEINFSEGLERVTSALEALSYEDVDMTNLAHIGTLLRDKYQIPSVRAITGIKLAAICGVDPRVRENMRMTTRVDRLKDHTEVHRKDFRAVRALGWCQLGLSKIRKSIGLK